MKRIDVYGDEIDDESEDDEWSEEDEVRRQMMEAEANEIWLEEPADEEESESDGMGHLPFSFVEMMQMNRSVPSPSDNNLGKEDKTKKESETKAHESQDPEH